MTEQTTKRIIALDLLRGYLLFFIIVDHLGRFPGFFDFFTGRGWLWVSASEGFFFISGLMVGYVRGRQIGRHGFKTICKKIWKRAGELYFWSILLTFISIAIVLLAGRPPGTKIGLPDQIQFGQLVFDTLRLHYIYGWADFLPHYVVFMAFAPIALYLLHKRATWLVVSFSLALWVFRGQSFNYAWQLLFFNGLVFGYYLPNIESWASKQTFQRTAYRSIISLAAATISLNVTLMYGLPVWRERFAGVTLPLIQQIMGYLEGFDRWVGPYFNKSTLAPGRIIIFFLWFAAFYLVFRRHELSLKKYLGGFLLPLGQNSLFVYGLHAIFTLLINLALPQAVGIPANILINASTLAVIWYITVKYKFWLAMLVQLFKSSSAKPQASKVSSVYESIAGRR